MATQIFDVVQSTSGKYVAQIIDENGDGLSSTQIETAILTLYDTVDNAIINSRHNQNVLNTNSVTIDTSGNLVWVWTPSDMPKIHTTRTPELHTALWTITWNAGNSKILHEVSFRVSKVNQP